MEIVPIKISLSEAIEARLKRSQIITFDMVDKLYNDADKLVPLYRKHVLKHEKKLGLKYDYWSEKTKQDIERQFEEKYYPAGKLKI